MIQIIGFFLVVIFTAAAAISALYLQHLIEEKHVSANVEIFGTFLFFVIFLFSPVVFSNLFMPHFMF